LGSPLFDVVAQEFEHLWQASSEQT